MSTRRYISEQVVIDDMLLMHYYCYWINDLLKIDIFQLLICQSNCSFGRLYVDIDKKFAQLHDIR